MDETKLRQLFKNSADAYLNTIDESVEQGMSEDCFIKAVNQAINFIPCCMGEAEQLFALLRYTMPDQFTDVALKNVIKGFIEQSK